MKTFVIASGNNEVKKAVVKSWCKDIEEGAMEQIDNLASLPFLHKHIAIMPDCHQGFGMPIGGVIATENVVIPNAVGVDISCGVHAVKTNIKNEDLSVEKIKTIMSEVRKRVPFGEGNYPPVDMEIVKYLEELEKEISDG